MKKTIKRLMFMALAMFAVVAISLAIHLNDVMRVSSNSGKTQMARIDIEEKIDTSESGSIRSTLNRIDGVKHSFLNAESKRLIFSYNPTTHTSDDIFKAFAAETNYSVALYEPSAEMASTGCPINTQKGVMSQISSLFN